MDMILHALPDDFNLNANGDVERGEGVAFLFDYFLVDQNGDFFVDQDGNFMIGYFDETVYPQILHALPDDFNLNSE